MVGLPWCSRLEYWCSTPTLPVPHHCRKSHPSGPSLRHNGIQTPQPYTAGSHTNGTHCLRHDHTHMRLKRRTHHCMRQSTCCDKSAPPGHPTMGQTNTARREGEAAGYHSSTYAHTTTLYNDTNAPSQQIPAPRITSKGGHPAA